MRLRPIILCVLLVPAILASQSMEEGLALMSKRRFIDAKAVFEQVLKQDDKNAAAHYRLGQVLLTNQCLDVEAAVDHMEEAVDLNPNSADFQYGLGAALGLKARDAGVLKQAFLAPKVKGAFEKAVQLNPDLVEAHVGLAEYYRRAPGFMGGDNDKAWKEVETITRLDELRGRPLKANFLLMDKQTAEAVQEIKLLTKNRSGEWRAWRTAGSFFLRNQMTDDAIASLEKYASMRPDTSDSHLMLARAFLQRKDTDKAMALAMKGKGIDPDSPQALEVLAQTHELKGQKKEAREYYERLLTTNLSAEQRKNLEKKINELQ